MWGGLTKATGNLGTALGLGVVAILRTTLNHNQMHSFGWRIPFWLGIVFGLVGIYLRSVIATDPDNTHDNESTASANAAAINGDDERTLLKDDAATSMIIDPSSSSSVEEGHTRIGVVSTALTFVGKSSRLRASRLPRSEPPSQGE
jgi:MFS family permease